MTPIDALVLAVLAAAVFTDVRRRRIPNWLTLSAAAAGLLLNLLLAGREGLALSAQGWAVGLLVFILPFILRWMGGGDIKLLAALGALEGPDFVLATAVLSAVVGGLLALFVLARNGQLRGSLRFLYAFWYRPNVGGTTAWGRIPYGPALALGAAAAMYLQRVP